MSAVALNVRAFLLSSRRGHLTYAAQKVGRLLLQAIRTKPRVADTVIKRKPSARPQTSNTFDSGMYTAADMALATTYMTFRSECDSKSLVAKGRRFERMLDWKALTK